MNIVIINELYNLGGAEVFALCEKELLQQDNNVLYLTLDRRYPNGWKGSENHFNYCCKDNKLTKLHHVIPRKRVVCDIRNILKDFLPDIIHLNGLDQYALEVYTAVKGYKVFQTIHDHYAVCPKGICIKVDQSACDGYCLGKCFKECFIRENSRYLYLDFAKWYIKRIYCRRSVENFVCPSDFLKQKCLYQKMRVTCINNPYVPCENTEQEIRKDRETKNYLFYGVISERKGLFQLIEAFIPFSQNKDVKLFVAGKCIGNTKEKLNRLLQNGKIEYIGELDHEDMIRYLSNVDVVVVPSVGMDNYPYVVLEAIDARCLVIASDRGGMQEIINDERLIFDVMSQEDIIQKLNYTYMMSDEEMNHIMLKNSHYLKTNNAPQVYLKRLYAYIDGII